MASSFAKPGPLRHGALVGVVAPASPIRREPLERGLAEIRRLGFRYRLGPNLYERGRYTAGSPEARASDFRSMWNDRDVDAVFCARGGYGAMELLDRLSVEELKRRSIVLLGSSDVTALLCALAAKVRLVSFHGPMVAQQMARGAYDARGLVGLVSDPRPAGLQHVPGLEVLHDGAAEGPLLGGCLSIVSALAGTEFLPSFEGSVLFLEDTGVKPYQIDRMLTQLRLAGRLDGVRGLVFGEMPGCEQHPEQGYRLQDMIRDWTAPMKIPVLFGFPSGHTVAESRTLPFGVRARVDAQGLRLLEGAVA